MDADADGRKLGHRALVPDMVAIMIRSYLCLLITYKGSVWAENVRQKTHLPVALNRAGSQ